MRIGQRSVSRIRNGNMDFRDRFPSTYRDDKILARGEEIFYRKDYFPFTVFPFLTDRRSRDPFLARLSMSKEDEISPRQCFTGNEFLAESINRLTRYSWILAWKNYSSFIR